MKKVKVFLNLSAIILGSVLCFSCQSDDYSDVASSNEEVKPSDKTLVELPSGATVARIGEQYTWQEDILLTEQQLELLASTGSPFEPMAEPQNESLELPAAFGGGKKESTTRSCAIYPNATYGQWYASYMPQAATTWKLNWHHLRKRQSRLLLDIGRQLPM